MQPAKHGHEAGHRDHGHGVQRFRLPLLFAGTVFVIAAYLSDLVYGKNNLVGDFSAALGAALLALPIFWVAIQDLLEGHMHMDELVALAVLAAMANGDFRTAGVVAFFMLISQVIETRTAQGAHKAIEKLVRLAPTTARRLEEEGGEREVQATELNAGDRIRVLPGETVPTDGAIVLGQTSINEASITGESLPRDKAAGEEVFAGTVNLTGMIEVNVTRVGEDTTIGRVRELILAAEHTKLPITKVIDKYAGFYTPVVLMIAALVWFGTSEWDRVVAILVMSCPCAFILATPTAMVAALSAAARRGILVKNVVDLESASRINALVFDKTGTLTTGNLGVERLSPAEGVSPADLVHTAAAVEQYSNHPAAVALLNLARETDVPIANAKDFKEEPGKGVTASVEGDVILVGRAAWLLENGVDVAEIDKSSRAEDAETFSIMFVSRAGKFLGWIGLRDQIREEAAEAIEELRNAGMKRISMISGDRESVVRLVAAELGGCEFEAECLPQEKAEYVARVKEQGFQVAFVGDGVNDAPALSASDTGIAMGAAGSDVAIDSATVALMSNDLMRVPFLLKLSHAARRAVYQNLAVGVVFIVGGLIVIAVTGYLTAIAAALLHNAGSLIVVFNSARLVRFGEVSNPAVLMEGFQDETVAS